MNYESYFLTNKIICNYEDIKNYYNYPSTQKSILYSFKNSIKQNMKLNNVNNSIENNELKKIDIIFENFKISNNIGLFCYELIKYKYNLKNKTAQFSKFNKLNNEVYLNPLYQINIEPSSINSQLKSFSLNNDYKNLLVQLDILYYGKNMNHKLYSIGLIYHKFSNFTFSLSNKVYEKFCTITEFFKNINYFLKKDNIKENIKLPIFFINLSETLQNILLENTKNINDISNLKEIINSNINNLSIKFLDILKKPDTKKEKVIIKEEYIIPYKFKDNKFIPLKLSEIKQLSKNLDEYLKSYNEIFDFFQLNFDYNNELIKKTENSLNVLYLLLHLHIKLFYDIYNQYINNLTLLLHSFSVSSNNNLHNLNFRNSSKYIDGLSLSLYKLKLIMLNNMVNIFLPSNTNNYYGVELDNNGFYIIKNNRFLNNTIYDYYPLFRNINIEKNLINFFIDVKNKYDMYDKKELLELGTQYYNNKYIHNGLSIFTKYFNKFKHVINGTIIIINNIKKYFNKCILIENLKVINNNYSYIISKNLDNDEQKYIEDILYNFFKENLENSSLSIIKILENKKSNNKEKMLSIENKENEILKSKIYYNNALITFQVIEYILVNINVKNNLIQKCSILQNNFTKIMSKK